MAGKSRIIGPGQKLVVSPGTPHRFWNEGDEDVRVFVEGSPGQRWLNFFEALFPVVGSGRINPLRLAVVLRKYVDTTYQARPPLLVQKAVLGILALIGRLLGYRPTVG